MRKIYFRKRTVLSVITIVLICFIWLFFYSKINWALLSYHFNNLGVKKTAIENGVIKSTVPIHVKKMELDLTDYGLPARVIRLDEPNKTGLKIIYSLSWFYMDEYINSKSDNSGISEINISEGLGTEKTKKNTTPKDIVGFELAEGYEAILIDAKGNTTRIIGPLRLLGKSEKEYSHGSVKDVDGEEEDDVLHVASVFDIDKSIGKDAVYRMYSKLWDYNHVKCWSVAAGSEGDADKYNRNNVKIYDIHTIKLKKTTLKEGVYLMKDVYNVVNCPEHRVEVNPPEPFDYISPQITGADGNDDEIKIDSFSLRTKNRINSLMVVGPYTVKIEREKEQTGSSTERQGIEISGKKGKIINIVNFWRLKGDGEEGPRETNTFSSIEIYPAVDEKEDENDKDFYNRCVIFKKMEGAGQWTNEVKYSRNGDSGGSVLHRYDIEIKVYDIPDSDEEPAVTAYTETDLKGQYFKLYRGDTDNVGYGKDIEKIRSLEVGPNTRVIFSNKEDCDISEKDTINYGEILGENSNEIKMVAVEGPCVINNLNDYLFNFYLEQTDGKYEIKENNLYSQLKALTIKAQNTEGNDYLVYNKVNGGVFCKGKFDNDNVINNEIKMKNYFPQSITINGNYFVKFYDKNNKRVKTLIGPLKNAKIKLEEQEYGDMLDKLSEKYSEYALYTDDYTLKSKIDGLEKPQKKDGRYSAYTVLRLKCGFDEMATKAREKYLSLAREIMEGVHDSYNTNEQFQKDLKNFAQGYIEQYYNARDIPTGQSWIKNYVGEGSKIEEKDNGNNSLGDLGVFFENRGGGGSESGIKNYLEERRKEVESDLNDYKNEVEKSIIDMFLKYSDMKMVIGRSTQRDQKGRSIEDVDGIVLYEGKNYNSNVRLEEDVWTCIRVNEDGQFVWDGEKRKAISLDGGIYQDMIRIGRKKVEVDYEKIGSIKISGSLLGKYKMILEVLEGNTKKTIVSRKSIEDLKELANTTKVISIKLEKLEYDKDFDILLDLPKGGSNEVTTNGIKVLTKEERLVEAGDFVEDNINSEEEISREVYLIDMLEVSDKIGLNYEYVYTYDMDAEGEDELVGVRFTKDIGKLERSEEDTTQTYQNVDDNVNDIVRDIEVKFNKNEESVSVAMKGTNIQWGVKGTVNQSTAKEYVLSDDYNQTKDSRNLIITDHGYLEDKSKIKNNSTVVVKSYRDVMEVPAILVKEITINTNTSNEGENSTKEKKYLKIADQIEIYESKEGGNKLHLYVPACYQEGGKWYTSYMLSQLGIQAKKSGDSTISLSV